MDDIRYEGILDQIALFCVQLVRYFIEPGLSFPGPQRTKAHAFRRSITSSVLERFCVSNEDA
jgi:hypothetical protein